MSKTVVIYLYVAGIGVARPAGSVKQLTAGQIAMFQSSIPMYKAQAETLLVPKLRAAGFMVDPSLWKWKVSKPWPDHLYLELILTFVDGNNEGKTAFMQRIANTGILNMESEIIKPYG